MEIGTICVKIAGRDSRKRCVIVDSIDERFVLIDGETRRRKCNLLHLEPTGEKLEVKKGADHETVVKAFKKAGIDIPESKRKEKGERPKRTRKVKESPPEEKLKPKKSSAKK